MDTESGLMPLLDEGTEPYELFEKCEECSVTVCRIDAPDPYAAEVMSRDMYWCPGYCAENTNTRGGRWNCSNSISKLPRP